MADYGVSRLEELTIKQDSSNPTPISVRLDEIVDCLSKLAGNLREGPVRFQLQGSAVPQILVNLLHQDVGDDRSRLFLEVGRVAANFGAWDDENLDALLQAGYPKIVLQTLSDRTQPLSFPANRALIASILNTVRHPHEATHEVLSQPDNFKLLISLVPLYSAFDGPADGAMDAAGWLWSIIEAIAIYSPANFSQALDKTNMMDLLYPLRAFTPPHQGVSQDCWPSVHSILRYLTGCLVPLADLESSPNTPVLPHVAACSDAPVVSVLLDFAEHGDLPSDYDWCSCEDSDEEDEVVGEARPTLKQKGVNRAKASVISLLTSLCWEIPYDPALPIWSRMRSWLSKGTEDRDDLMNAALMCFANGVRSADTGLKLLSGEHSLLPVIMPLLSPNTKVTTQHALIGLLKNLAHPSENKVILGDAGVISRLLQMEVFSDKRDVVGTVQGGSAGLIKLLCLDNVKNSSEFLRHPDALDQVLALIKRTDDPNIGYEATRIFISVIKSVSKTKNESSVDPARLCQRDVITCLVDLLRRTWKWPILINDSMISLTLLTISGPEGTAAIIMEELELEHPAKEEEEGSGAKVIQKIISSDELDQGIKSNAETIMLQLKERSGGRTIDVTPT